MNPKRSSNGFLIIILLLAIGIYYFSSTLHTGSSDYSYQTFLNDVKNEKVQSITIEQNKEVPTGSLTAEYKGDEYKTCQLTDVNQALDDIEEASPDLAAKVNLKGIDRSGEMISNLLSVVLPVGIVIFFMVMMMRQNGGGNGKMMDFGKSRAKLANPNGRKVTFQDVAGLMKKKKNWQRLWNF